MNEAAPPAAKAAHPLSGVVHLVRPVGPRARGLASLRTAIAELPDRSLFYHCVHQRLRHPSGDEPPPDDLAAWAATVLQDREAAERLAFATQTRNGGASELRAALLEVLDALVSRSRHDVEVPDEAALVLLSAESVPIATGREPSSGADLLEDLANSHVEVWFYHLVEQPWFDSGRTPLLEWLRASGEERLAALLAEFADGHLALLAARERVLRRWRMSTLPRRLADAGRSPDVSRREAGRDAVTRLVRRVRRASGPGS